MKETISLIIPTFNEKDNVTPLVARVHQALAGYDHEIILVDDNSKDGTIETAEALAPRYPVKVIVRRDERGLASAVVHGLKYASGSIIGVMDADLQHPPEKLPDLVKAIEGGADMVIGSRYIPGGGCPNWDLTRKVISKAALMVSHLLLPSTRRVKDPLAGFFMFRRDKVDIAKLKPIGYKISLEVMLTGDFKNIVEVPYIFEERSAGQSKLNMMQQWDYLKHLFSLMRRTGELAMFLKFVAVGLSGVVVNEGAYWLLTRFGGLETLNWLANLIGIETSIITNFVLNDSFTFRQKRSVSPFIVRLLKFNLTCAAGASIQWGLFMFFTRVTGLYDLLANFIGIVVAFLVNYFINRNWTWK
ncbi:MAG: glycosyltransferase family 2 protein [Dehalococcoidales bacterium]|jgi:dolichol-phosphate mannosyltransferase